MQNEAARSEDTDIVLPLFGKGCSDCREVCSSLLRRSGIDPSCNTRSPWAFPEHGSEYLRKDNPRLMELRMQYEAFSSRAPRPSQQFREYQRHGVPLNTFRADSTRVGQHGSLDSPSSYVLTAHYMLAGPHEPFLRRMSEDGAFGVYSVPLEQGLLLSKDVLDSANELEFLRRHGVLDSDRGRTLLEVGGGHGRFAHRVHEAYHGLHSVLCADADPESTFLCEYYLSYRGLPAGSVSPLPDLAHRLTLTRFDAAVNIHSFSRCSLASITWWLDLVREHAIRYLFIVPGSDRDGGDTLLTTEPAGSRLPFGHVFRERGYRLVAREPKYSNPAIQKYGVTPTYYYLFELGRGL